MLNQVKVKIHLNVKLNSGNLGFPLGTATRISKYKHEKNEKNNGNAPLTLLTNHFAPPSMLLDID